MSNIEWTDATWNPVIGCTPVSPGCLNCYAASMAWRLAHKHGTPEYHDRDEYVPPTPHTAFGHRPAGVRTVRIAEVRDGRAVFTGDVRTLPDRLGEPLRWRKPRRVFVNSMSDLFHEAVPDEFIRLVFAVMSYCGQHTFQVLTKRPDRMAAWLADEANSLSACQAEYCIHFACKDPALTPTGKSRLRDTRSINGTRKGLGDGNYWPLPNVWLGTSVEDQARADERIPHLLRCPAAVRFLSCEPLLGPVDLSAYFGGAYVGLPGDVVHPNYNFGVNWVIVGGESGPHSRHCDIEWIRSIVAQCKIAGVPVFVKQLGAKPVFDVSLGTPTAGREWVEAWLEQRVPYSIEGGCADAVLAFRLADRKGGDPAEWPEDLRVRQWPEVVCD